MNGGSTEYLLHYATSSYNCSNTMPFPLSSPAVLVILHFIPKRNKIMRK